MSDQMTTPTQEQEQNQQVQEQSDQTPLTSEAVDLELVDINLLTDQNQQELDQPESVNMTFDEFDQFMEQAADVELFNCKPYWPTSGDLEMYERDFPLRELVLFLSWLLEMNEPPKTDAEVRSQKAIKQFVYERLNLVEELPETPLSEEVDAQ